MRLNEAHFAFAEPAPLTFTVGVSDPFPASTAEDLHARDTFATDDDWRAYLGREQEAATIRGDTDLAALAAEELAKP
jgi:hypothetical protein